MGAIPIRELTTSFQTRYENTSNVPHRGLSVGMVRDVASYLAPEGSCYDAVNMLVDLPGKIRKRGAYTTPNGGSAATATVENLLSYKSNAIDGVAAIWGTLGKAGGAVTNLATSNGAMTSIGVIGSAKTWACKPFQHGNLIVMPFQALGTTVNDTNSILFGGGGTGTGTITSATVTAKDNRVTAIVGFTLTAAHLGSIITLNDGGTHVYEGRIVEVTTTTPGAGAVRVDPVPKTAIAANGGAVAALWQPNSIGTTYDQITGRYGVSFQGRIVLGSILRTQGAILANLAKGLDLQSNTIIWSQLQTETLSAATGADGQAVLYANAFTGPNAAPYFNTQEIPDLGGMTGLATVGEGELLIFGPRRMYKLTGQLTTETEANAEVLYSVDQASNNVGIPAPGVGVGDRPDNSIQYTPFGLIFASNDNIYLYDGSKLTGLLDNTMQRYYQSRRIAGDPIYGSFYYAPKNHYYLSMGGSDEGLMINLQNHGVTRQTNVKFFTAVADPADSTKLWGAYWWDVTGAAPSLTGGQLLALDPMWKPTSGNVVDPNGASANATFISKAYMDGTLESNKLFRELHIDIDARASGSFNGVTWTADTVLDPAFASFVSLTQGVLTFPRTAPTVMHMDTTNQLKEGKALVLKMSPNNDADSLELYGFNIGFQQRALT